MCGQGRMYGIGLGAVKVTLGRLNGTLTDMEMVKCDRCRVTLPLVDYSEKKIPSVSFYPPNSEDNRGR
jgi:hypothetical protein